MKKAILAALGIIAICTICLAQIASAAAAGYVLENVAGTDVTANGSVGSGEWTDAFGDWLYDGWTKTTSTTHNKYEFGGTPTVGDEFLIEVLSDTTNDAGDSFTFCCCGAADSTLTPQSADDVKIVHTHSGTTIYRGTGTGWAVDASIVLGTNVVIASSIAASPTSATPHWIIELKFDKSGGIAGMGFNTNCRFAAFDASTGKTLMWPPMSSTDVPNTYGLNDYSDFTSVTIPEGISIGVMVLLASVVVIVSSRYFRKPPKAKSYRL